MTLTHGSLFAGCGGLDLAIADVFGATTAWVSEFEAAPSRVLAHHYPDAPNLGDVTRVDWATVEPVDIISGGSPCPDLSTAGRRAGMNPGTRSNLWVSMREAIGVLKPTYVVWENVRGAMSADAASDLEHCPGCMGDPRDRGPVLRALGRVLGDLADLGFDAEWHGLRAADVGACHGRWRVFVLARRRAAADADRAGRSEHGRPESVRPELGTAQRAGDAAGLTLLPTPTVSDTNGAGAHGTGGADLRTAVALLPTPRATRGGSHTESVALLPTPTTTDRGKRNIDRRRKLGRQIELSDVASETDRWGDYAEAITRHERAFGQPAPDPTEPGAKGNPRLSARFVEWMMMLPAGWVTDRDVTRNEALKMLGNGVVPAQAAAALRLMLGRLS